MLEKGDTPPNIRSDIDDAPPDPTAPPPPPRMQPRPKPWEARAPNQGAAAAAPWLLPANGARMHILPRVAPLSISHCRPLLHDALGGKPTLSTAQTLVDFLCAHAVADQAHQLPCSIGSVMQTHWPGIISRKQRHLRCVFRNVCGKVVRAMRNGELQWAMFSREHSVAGAGAANGDSTVSPPAPSFPPASRAMLVAGEGGADAGTGHADPWKPPAVPQRSMPPANSTPPPAADKPLAQDGGGSSSGSTSAAAEADPEPATA